MIPFLMEMKKIHDETESDPAWQNDEFDPPIISWNIGTWFSVVMIAFAGAAILYDTSKIMHHYPEDRYVGAALELFASVALMFWYVLRLFMSRD